MLKGQLSVLVELPLEASVNPSPVQYTVEFTSFFISWLNSESNMRVTCENLGLNPGYPQYPANCRGIWETIERIAKHAASMGYTSIEIGW